jgi:hypothetical protein
VWILIGFDADPDMDLAFYLNGDPDPGSLTNAFPYTGQTLSSQRVDFKIYT